MLSSVGFHLLPSREVLAYGMAGSEEVHSGGRLGIVQPVLMTLGWGGWAHTGD